MKPVTMKTEFLLRWFGLCVTAKKAGVTSQEQTLIITQNWYNHWTSQKIHRAWSSKKWPKKPRDPTQTLQALVGRLKVMIGDFCNKVFGTNNAMFQMYSESENYDFPLGKKINWNTFGGWAKICKDNFSFRYGRSSNPQQSEEAETWHAYKECI